MKHMKRMCDHCLTGHHQPCQRPVGRTYINGCVCSCVCNSPEFPLRVKPAVAFELIVDPAFKHVKTEDLIQQANKKISCVSDRATAIAVLKGVNDLGVWIADVMRESETITQQAVNEVGPITPTLPLRADQYIFLRGKR